WVGWPLPRWIDRFRPDPLKTLRLEDIGEEIQTIATGTVSAQAAEVTNAVQALADGLSASMHPTWRAAVHHAARSQLAKVPSTLTKELTDLAPELDRVPGWWKLLKAWQYLPVAAFGLGVVWLLLGLLAPGVLPPSLGDPAALPWAALMT